MKVQISWIDLKNCSSSDARANAACERLLQLLQLADWHAAAEAAEAEADTVNACFTNKRNDWAER